jgi:hypothetical protein
MMALRAATVLARVGTVVAGALLGGLAAAADKPPTCGAHLAGPARQQAEGGGWVIAFAPRTWPVPVGRHFALDIAVCPPAGAPAPAVLKVDADMPAHKHGMNYRPSVKALGNGRYTADGLMFHMPGRWRLLFSVGDGAPITRELTIP